ncbi:hypothetical protein ACVWYQ_003374 [Bradyrhizobium sp. USDA 3397]
MSSFKSRRLRPEFVGSVSMRSSPLMARIQDFPQLGLPLSDVAVDELYRLTSDGSRICRSLTGKVVRDIITEITLRKIPTGTRCFGREIAREARLPFSRYDDLRTAVRIRNWRSRPTAERAFGRHVVSILDLLAYTDGATCFVKLPEAHRKRAWLLQAIPSWGWSRGYSNERNGCAYWRRRSGTVAMLSTSSSPRAIRPSSLDSSRLLASN